MDVHSSFLSVLLLTCWSGQLTYGNPMSLNQMTTQADDHQMNETNHENFVNGSLPREWLRGAKVEEAETFYDDEASIDLEAINTCDCAPVTAFSTNHNRHVEDACS